MDEEDIIEPGSCPVEFGGKREDCAAWPACSCDAPPLYRIKVGNLTQAQRDQRWAPPITVSIWRKTEGEA